jgi:PDZ domain-containing protein
MSTSETTLPLSAARPPRRRRRWPVVVGGLLAVLVAFVVVASLITVPYYAIVPGDAVRVDRLITVPPQQRHPVHGRVLLTDVGVNTLKLIQYIPARLGLDANTDLVPQTALTGNLPVKEFDQQGIVDMAESQLTAEAVALRQLGYSVPEHDVGVTLYVIAPGSPAWVSHLQVGDVVTSIDGTPTTNPDALIAAVRAHRPGDVVTVRAGSISHPLPGRAVTVRLGSTVANGQTIPVLGIGSPQSGLRPMGTQPVYDFPFPVSINSDQIGGPSAGLAFTLGIINPLTGGDITGGRIVAATGTIRPDGTIGDVGGVKQKTVAVERAGATVFFVPKVQGHAELNLARRMATGDLKVFEVGSLSQALADLQHLGGVLGRAQAGPPPGPGGHSVPYGWPSAPWS